MGSTTHPTYKTERGKDTEQPKPACDFHASSRKSSTPRFQLHLPLISRVSVKSVWLGDTRRLFYEEGNGVIHHPMRPNHSSNSFLAYLCSCHEVEPCTKSQPRGNGYQELLALFFSTSARLILSPHLKSADCLQAPINQAESADDNAARYWSGAIGDIQGRASCSHQSLGNRVALGCSQSPRTELMR